MSRAARHRAPTPHRRVRPVAAAVAGALVIGALTTGSTSARFTDTARADVPAATYTVPVGAANEAQISGTGEFIQTRLHITGCANPSEIRWRWRDHLKIWGDAWNGWSPWSNALSEPGWTTWSTSDLTAAFIVAEAEWDVSCGYASWQSPSNVAGPLQFVRTT